MHVSPANPSSRVLNKSSDKEQLEQEQVINCETCRFTLLSTRRAGRSDVVPIYAVHTHARAQATISEESIRDEDGIL